MQLRHVLLFLTVGFVTLAVFRERESSLRTARNPQASADAVAAPRKFPARLVVKAALDSGLRAIDSYRQLLNNDEFCEVARLTKDFDKKLAAEFFESINLNSDSVFGELASANGPFLGNPVGKAYTSRAARFMQALKLSGDLGSASQKSLRDPLTAWALLTQLHSEDPSNAAYLFFRLGIEQDQEYPLDQRQNTISDLLRATEFHSYSADLYHETISRMRENASKFFAGMVVVTQIPFPNYSRGMEALREMEYDRPGLSAAVGNLMANGPLNARDSFKIGGYNALEYSLGRSLLKGAGLPQREDLERSKNGPRGDFSDLVRDSDSECNETARQQFLSDMAEWL